MGTKPTTLNHWKYFRPLTQFQAICPSPSNTVSANVRFFSTVGATKLLYAPESSTSLKALLESIDETIMSIPTPSYSEMMEKSHVDEFPFNYTFDEIKDKPSSECPNTIFYLLCLVCVISDCYKHISQVLSYLLLFHIVL